MISRSNRRREIMKHALLWFVLSFSFFPLYFMVVVSMKNNNQYWQNPWMFDSPSAWHWENWSHAWLTVQNSLANSVTVSVTAVLLGMTMVVLTSYVVARYRFPGRNLLYYGVVASMFLPGTSATLATLIMLLKNLNLMNSLLCLIVLGSAGGQVAGIFILRQFIEDIPKELFESAQIDGAGHLSQIRHIVLPMSGSVLSTLAIMQFLGVWNEMMLPLLVIKDDQLRTIPVALMLLDGEYQKMWGPLMATYTLASIPLVLLFLFTMRLFVKGLSAGAVKG